MTEKKKNSFVFLHTSSKGNKVQVRLFRKEKVTTFRFFTPDGKHPVESVEEWEELLSAIDVISQSVFKEETPYEKKEGLGDGDGPEEALGDCGEGGGSCDYYPTAADLSDDSRA